MKTYVEPSIEVESFDVEDVITTSGWEQGEGETERG